MYITLNNIINGNNLVILLTKIVHSNIQLMCLAVIYSNITQKIMVGLCDQTDQSIVALFSHNSCTLPTPQQIKMKNINQNR